LIACPHARRQLFVHTCGCPPMWLSSSGLNLISIYILSIAFQMRSVRRVGLVGSSGGGSATLGHGDASALVARVRQELSRVGQPRGEGAPGDANDHRTTVVVELAYAQVVHCTAPLDRASLGEESAQLVVLQSEHDEDVSVACRGTLAEVNAQARESDRARFGPEAARGAEMNGDADGASRAITPAPPRLDALVFVSSSPLDVNVNAAAWCLRERVPVVATGGTSLGQLLALGVQVGGSSGGSVATTPTSKAVSYAASLAGLWGLPYTPSASSTASSSSSSVGAVESATKFTSRLFADFYGTALSVLGGCLPVFLAVSLLRAGLALFLGSNDIHGVTAAAGGNFVGVPSAHGMLALPEVAIRALALRPLEAVLRSGVLPAVAVAASAAVEASGGLGSRGLGELAVLAGCLAGGIVACAPHGAEASWGLAAEGGGESAYASSSGGGSGDTVGAAGYDPNARSSSSLALVPVASALAALVAGVLAGKLAPALLAAASRWGAPATAASLLSAGLGGTGAGWAVLVLRLPQACSWLSGVLREWGGHPDAVSSSPCIASAMAAAAPSSLSVCSQRALLGGVLGAGVLHGSMYYGLYHALLLPLLVVEMESGHWSLLGSFDLCCLVLPCAGLCAGTLLADQVRRCGVLFADQRRHGSAQPSGWAPLCRRGLWLNLAFGDFVEAAMPLMERAPVCAWGAYVGAAAGGAVVNACRCRSSAYLPLPVAIGLAQSPVDANRATGDSLSWGVGSSWSAQTSVSLAAVVAFGVPALVCACSPVASRPMEPAFVKALGRFGELRVMARRSK